jgi:polyisoprenyl-teichoic acid--peptidoglycan teichoic acid transferase
MTDRSRGDWQYRKQERARNRISLTRWAWWGMGGTIALMASATIGAIAAWVVPSATKPLTRPFVQSQSEEPNGFDYKLSRPMHILLLGVDKPDDGAEKFSGRSDTILLLRFDPAEGSASLLSIPRDTQVDLPEVGLTKINQTNSDGGIQATTAAVRQLLGEIAVDRYVRIDTQALQELVDLMGGVEVFVPEPMSYVDRAGKFKIDLDPGWQVLNGTQAEQFSRYRVGGYGDIGRVQRQQELIKAIRSRLTHPTILPKLPEAIRMMRKHLDTNLSAPEMMALVQFGLQLSPDRLRQVMLPGQFSSQEDFDTSYWLVDAQRRDLVLQEYFKYASIPPEAETEGMYAPPSEARSSAESLRIVIQNATQNSEAGKQLQAYLAEKGFENAYLAENWQPPRPVPNYRQRQTQIIAQQGNLAGADRLFRILGIGKIVPASTGDLDSDVTIRIGEDFLKVRETKFKVKNLNRNSDRSENSTPP